MSSKQPKIDKNLLILGLFPLVVIAALIITRLLSPDANIQKKLLDLEKNAEETPEIYVQDLANQEQNQMAMQKSEQLFDHVGEYLPKNPNQATAYCQSTGAAIVSNTPSNCPDPVFSWSGADGKGQDIVGYLVYWYEEGIDTPKTSLTDTGVEYSQDKPPIIVDKPEFAPWPIDLELGKTYNLMVQTMTAKQAGIDQMGGEIIDPDNKVIENAKPIFTYRYQ